MTCGHCTKITMVQFGKLPAYTGRFIHSWRFYVAGKSISLSLFLSLILCLGLPSGAATAPLPRAPLPKYSVDIVTKAPQPYHVSVKFIDAAKVRVSASQGSRVSSLSGYNVTELQGFINANQLTLTPEINLDAAVIARVEAEALRHSNIMQPDLAGMFRVRFATTTPSEQQKIANALQALAIVEYVDAATSQPPPPVDIAPTTPLYESWQTYLGPTPGLNFNYAASVGLTGSTMQYVDIEYCWLPEHEDIGNRLQQEPNQTPAANGIFSYCSHGAAATSVISAVPNAYGMKGAAPDATVYVHPERIVDAFGNQVTRRAAAIISGINTTTMGDALMLEMQQYTDNGQLGPAEIEMAVWVATKAATDALRVVVAAAGNGAVDLDGAGPVVAAYRQRGDSGAIIVGAGRSAGRVPMPFSTYGSRVNLQGWGENVAAFGYAFPVPGAPTDERQTYTAGFNGTSSATPLVTASALLVQQRAKVALGGVMLPRELRSYLAATGTPQAPDLRTIGPLPNMFAAITRLNEADVGITAQVGGSLATAAATNHGPSRARDLVVDVDIYSNSVVGLTRVDNTQAVCVGRPPPVGTQCAGQCSYIRCTYPALAAGPGPLTWACIGSYGTPSLTLSASVVSGSHTDPVSSNHVATQSAPLSCTSGSAF